MNSSINDIPSNILRPDVDEKLKIFTWTELVSGFAELDLCEIDSLYQEKVTATSSCWNFSTHAFFFCDLNGILVQANASFSRLFNLENKKNGDFKVSELVNTFEV